MANPRFILKRSSDTQFFFNLLASNGEVILTSERYTTKANALKGTAAVGANAPLPERYFKYVASNDQPYFVLRAANQEALGTSELYSSDAARDGGIDAVMRAAVMAEVVDAT